MGPDSANRVQNLCRTRLRIFVSTVNATFGLTKKLYTLTVHGDKAGNVLKSTCGGDRLEDDYRKNKTLQFKFWHVIKLINRNMTRCKKHFQNITPVFFEIQNLRLWYFSTSECSVRDFLIQKIRKFRIFVSNSCLLKLQRKCKTCRFLGVTWFNIWFFCVQTS